MARNGLHLGSITSGSRHVCILALVHELRGFQRCDSMIPRSRRCLASRAVRKFYLPPRSISNQTFCGLSAARHDHDFCFMAMPFRGRAPHGTSRSTVATCVPECGRIPTLNPYVSFWLTCLGRVVGSTFRWRSVEFSKAGWWGVKSPTGAKCNNFAPASAVDYYLGRCKSSGYRHLAWRE